MKWEKLGHVFVAAGQHDWMATHAALPFPIRIDKNIYRIYFSCRNTQRRSHGAYVIMDLENLKILEIAAQPVLSPGKPGYFDDAGTLITQLVKNDNGYLAYYVGWSERVAVPFQNSVGLATCDRQFGNWQKYSNAPLLDRNHNDPLNLSYPWVLKGRDNWKMWYGSHLAWEKNGMDMLHVIKYAESTDGINWQRDNTVCIPLLPGESGISRPCVVMGNGIYHMWYSRRAGRKEAYRLGYATSQDGKIWQRRDEEAGLTASKNPNDWDSEMICYPCVFDEGDCRYMLYNGNGFGRTGFGLAVLEKK